MTVTGADLIAAHITECVGADAALVVDGNADDLITTLVAAGWTWDGSVEHMFGKRIRYLVPPGDVIIEGRLK